MKVSVLSVDPITRRSLFPYTPDFTIQAKRMVENGTYILNAEITGQMRAANDEETAEEAFDLTNNPSRQDEREERYGRHRSVSVGDIVRIESNGKVVDMLCANSGWVQL